MSSSSSSALLFVSLLAAVVMPVLGYAAAQKRRAERAQELAASSLQAEAAAKGREEALRKERDALAALLEGQPDPVLAVGRDLTVFFANRAARLLFRRDAEAGHPDGQAQEGSAGRDEFVGRTAIDVVRDYEIHKLIEEGIARRREVAGTVEFEGEPQRIFRVMVAPVESAGFEGVVCAFHDETALWRLERVRSDFVANVSHELRTPLTAIHGFIETLQDTLHKHPERALRHLEIMHHETSRLTALINDLLHLSRLEAPGVQLNLEELDLAAVGRDVAELCRRAAEQKGLHLTFSAQGELPVIRADEGLVRQAILNLIDNAVKYTEPGGRIHVSVDRDGDGVRLLVKDTGVGIPRDSLTRVFERFYRVDKARSRREGGTGLGLSIVKHIVESHKGRLHIESELGRGTTIGFTLPAA